MMLLTLFNTRNSSRSNTNVTSANISIFTTNNTIATITTTTKN